MFKDYLEKIRQSNFNLSFFRFAFGRMASMSAFQMMAVIVGWDVYDKTNSALDLGLVGLFQFLPRILFVLHAGQVADRFDRRKVILVVEILQFIAMGTLSLLAFFHFFNLYLVFGLLFLIGSAKAFELPAMQAHLSNIVPYAALPKAVALTASMVQGAIIVGPALGGVLYLLGPDWSYLLCAFLVFAAGWLVFFTTVLIKPLFNADRKVDLFSGIQFIRQKPIILGAISLDMFAVLLGGATALMPIVARDVLHVNSMGLGVLRASPALGAILMSFYLSKKSMERHIGKKMFLAVGLFGLCTIGFGLSHSLWLSVCLLAVLGASDMVSMVVRGSLVQLETPNEMRGRVGAVSSLFIGASNQLGEFESGVTATWLGLIPSIILGGLGSIVIAAMWIYLFPSLWKKYSFILVESKPVEEAKPKSRLPTSASETATGK